eukprot:5099904-Prymnesium_polylepis.4
MFDEFNRAVEGGSAILHAEELVAKCAKHIDDPPKGALNFGRGQVLVRRRLRGGRASPLRSCRASDFLLRLPSPALLRVRVSFCGVSADVADERVGDEALYEPRAAPRPKTLVAGLPTLAGLTRQTRRMVLLGFFADPAGLQEGPGLWLRLRHSARGAHAHRLRTQQSGRWQRAAGLW